MSLVGKLYKTPSQQMLCLSSLQLLLNFQGDPGTALDFDHSAFMTVSRTLLFYIIILIMQSSDVHVKSRQTFRRGTEGVMVSNTTKDNIGNTNLVGVHLTMVINFKIYLNMTIKLTDW